MTLSASCRLNLRKYDFLLVNVVHRDDIGLDKKFQLRRLKNEWVGRTGFSDFNFWNWISTRYRYTPYTLLWSCTYWNFNFVGWKNEWVYFDIFCFILVFIWIVGGRLPHFNSNLIYKIKIYEFIVEFSIILSKCPANFSSLCSNLENYKFQECKDGVPFNVLKYI